MKIKEPNFDTGKELMEWRRSYVKNWLKEHHPSLTCTWRKTKVGGEDLWICLNQYLSDDTILFGIQCPEYAKDSENVIGKAVVMKGLHAFTAPVMCERIERRIKQTGNYDFLTFLDSLVKLSGKYY